MVPGNQKRKKDFRILLLGLAISTSAFALSFQNPYETSSPERIAQFKSVRLPFRSGTSFTVTQGAFGASSHREPGNEYHWDLAVPYGTEVVALESGKVLEVWEPGKGGACEPAFSRLAHNVKIEAEDGTVAQYVHVRSLVRMGDTVKVGQLIARTAKNGWICAPHLQLGVYRSKTHLYASTKRETVPLRFRGIPDSLLLEGKHYTVP